MRALYLAGREADALAVYGDARAQLAAQLGVDPSPQLEQVYLAVLRQSLPGGGYPASSVPEPGNDAAVPGPPVTLRVPLASLVGRDDQVAQVETRQRRRCSPHLPRARWDAAGHRAVRRPSAHHVAGPAQQAAP